MRDIIKDQNYWKKFIEDSQLNIDKSYSWLIEGKISSDNINHFKRYIIQLHINLINAYYSAGFDRSYLINDYYKALRLMHDSWGGFWKLTAGKPVKIYNQYVLSGYDEMLWMLSLGCLLDVDESNYRLLLDIIDRDDVKDNLYEYIISYKMKNRHSITSESYEKYFYVPKAFETLRNAIVESNKKEVEKLICRFITNEWYKNHKGVGWYSSHKSVHNTYSGYWSYETAAIVKIMKIDDNSFRDCPYYPKDLL